MSAKVLKILAAIKPPKDEGFEESTIQDAIEACPVLKTYQGYGQLDPWQTGVFTALGKLHDALVDAGLEDILTNITENDIAATDDYLSQEDGEVMRALPELRKFLAAGETDPFKAGVICAFTAVYLQMRTEPSVADLESFAPDPDTIREVPPAPAPGPVPVTTAAIKTDFNELIEALHTIGMNVNNIRLSVVRKDNRNIISMFGHLGVSIPFGEVAKINAVFRTVTGKDLVLVTNFGGERETNGIGFNFEI